MSRQQQRQLQHQYPHPHPQGTPIPLGGSPGPPLASQRELCQKQTLTATTATTATLASIGAAATTTAAAAITTTVNTVNSTTNTAALAVGDVTSTPRCPPSWTRHVGPQGHIVYRTALGHEIHNTKQLRDFLLSDVTCKCGLPCPLIIEKWFDFSPPQANTNGVATSLTYAKTHLPISASSSTATATLSCGTTLSVVGSSSIDDTVTSSSRAAQSTSTAVTPVSQSREDELNKPLSDQWRGSCSSAAVPVDAVAGGGNATVAAVTASGSIRGSIRRKASARKGPYEGLLVSQLLAKQRDRRVTRKTAYSSSRAESRVSEKKDKEPQLLVQQDAVSVANIRQQRCSPLPTVLDKSSLDTHGRALLPQPVVARVEVAKTEIDIDTSSLLPFRVEPVRLSEDDDSVVESAQQASFIEKHTSRVSPLHVHTDVAGADDVIVLASELPQQQQQPQQQPLLVATMDTSQIYQQPLQVYCSSTGGPTGSHPAGSILLSPQSSADQFVLQNNNLAGSSMNSLAAAVNSLTGGGASLGGTLGGAAAAAAAMNGLVNSLSVQHGSQAAVAAAVAAAAAAVNLNSLNAAVNNISSAQVLLSAGASQLLTYSSVLNPLPMSTCPGGVPPIAVLGVSPAIPPISIVGVGPPQQLPLSQMSPQMHGALQLQNHHHPQLLSPPQAAGGQQVTAGGTIVMSAGPYCGPTVRTAVAPMTFDTSVPTTVSLNLTSTGQHLQHQQQQQPQHNEAHSGMSTQQSQVNGGNNCATLCPVSLSLASDTSDGVCSGRSSSCSSSSGNYSDGCATTLTATTSTMTTTAATTGQPILPMVADCISGFGSSCCNNSIVSGCGGGGSGGINNNNNNHHNNSDNHYSSGNVGVGNVNINSSNNNNNNNNNNSNNSNNNSNNNNNNNNVSCPAALQLYNVTALAESGMGLLLQASPAQMATTTAVTTASSAASQPGRTVPPITGSAAIAALQPTTVTGSRHVHLAPLPPCSSPSSYS